MARGKVKWFSKERGYGFISPLGGGEDVFVEAFFVHNSGIAGPGSRNLEKEERVAYQLSQDRWGSTAKNVCILKSSRTTDRQTGGGEGRSLYTLRTPASRSEPRG